MTETPQSNPFTDVNPYRPSEMPDVATRRTGGLTAICIIAVVLGVLGTLSAAAKGFNVLFGAQVQQTIGSIGAVNEAQRQAQQDMNNAMAAEMKRFRLANSILCVAQLGLCIGLLVAGLRTLGLKASGRQLLVWICVSLLVYEIGQFVVFAFQQLSIAPIMELYMPKMMKGPDGEDIGGEKFGKVIARMSIVVGMVTQCAWTLIKLVFYAVAIRYLRKRNVVALFETSPDPAFAPPEVT
ncbi:MAG: hypothetical protein H8E66_02970 [Planctomycetes bacterium]|nr:hypothetical protein [Planctomycetota bacterium]